MNPPQSPSLSADEWLPEPPRHRRWPWLVAALLLAGGTLFGWMRGGENPDPVYRTLPVERGDVVRQVAANGTLNPVNVVSVGTNVSGTVKKLYVDFNDQVEKGQVLLEIEDALLAAQVRQSQASLASAQAALELARQTETRNRDLLAQQFVAQQDLDQAVQGRQAAEAALAQAQAQAERDQINLSYAVIRSPISGVVMDREVDVGQTVAASFQTPTLIKIAQDLTRMQIDASFAEADIGMIEPGQKVRFTVDAYPERTFSGLVRQIRLNPAVEQNVVTYDVVIGVDNPERILLPGMTAYVSIVVAQSADVLLLPNAALRFHPRDGASGASGKGRKGKDGATPGATVWVPEGAGIKPVKVAVGLSDGRMTEVLAGDLNEGDVVVTGETGAASSNGATPPPVMRMF
ncbi:MAG: efflux RND transporter periplasmic adaptor subunit [Alphaproteobacteria bacterium CG_4_10_14_0_2_um_filter_63_37]|nr:MAG: efflux RND transporter periplasmic adaptor subunit [Alphaproteobacteria bacterium CG_4_10_14_0_2_um_filter_63_37]